MARTQADIPPVIGAEYRGASQPEAVAEATGDGYTRTQKISNPRPSQFGLPRSVVPKSRPKIPGKGNAV